MARRSSKRTPATAASATSEPNPAFQEVIDRINVMIASGDRTLYEITAPVEASVLMVDGNYKVKPFSGGQEVLFKGIRAGKRSEFIFEFAPVDDQPFTQIEFTEKKVFMAIDGFERRLVEALGGDEDASFVYAARALGTRLANEAAELKAAAEARSNSFYESNPMFGMF